jgi:phosphoglycerate dehydrogenase-like enzyme
MQRPNAILVMRSDLLDRVYGPHERGEIENLVRMVAPPLTAKSLAEQPELLGDVDVMISGWGAPMVDADFLAKAPKLKAIFYAAGAIGYWASEAAWDRGVQITTSTEANSIPVTQYTLAMILLGLKRALPLARTTREKRGFVYTPPPGIFGSSVGLISLGSIARRVLEMLRPFELVVNVFDPFLTDAAAAEMGVRKMTLLELFSNSDVVSLHTPLLKETVGMVTATHLNAMRPGATFINTARGAVVVETDLLEVAEKRPDLQFILDVTHPEPPPSESKLYDLPNVLLTPHIAGSVGGECRRLGQYMVEELKRYLQGEPLKWVVTREAAQSSAHRPQA